MSTPPSGPSSHNLQPGQSIPPPHPYQGQPPQQPMPHQGQPPYQGHPPQQQSPQPPEPSTPSESRGRHAYTPPESAPAGQWYSSDDATASGAGEAHSTSSPSGASGESVSPLPEPPAPEVVADPVSHPARPQEETQEGAEVSTPAEPLAAPVQATSAHPASSAGDHQGQTGASQGASDKVASTEDSAAQTSWSAPQPAQPPHPPAHHPAQAVAPTPSAQPTPSVQPVAPVQPTPAGQPAAANGHAAPRRQSLRGQSQQSPGADQGYQQQGHTHYGAPGYAQGGGQPLNYGAAHSAPSANAYGGGGQQPYGYDATGANVGAWQGGTQGQAQQAPQAQQAAPTQQMPTPHAGYQQGVPASYPSQQAQGYPAQGQAGYAHAPVQAHAQPYPAPAQEQPGERKKKGKGKAIGIAMLIVVLAAAALFVVWKFVLNKDDDASASGGSKVTTAQYQQGAEKLYAASYSGENAAQAHQQMAACFASNTFSTASAQTKTAISQGEDITKQNPDYSVLSAQFHQCAGSVALEATGEVSRDGFISAMTGFFAKSVPDLSEEHLEQITSCITDQTFDQVSPETRALIFQGYDILEGNPDYELVERAASSCVDAMK